MSDAPPPSPQNAFDPVHPDRFDLPAARHLLRRLGYSATPEASAAALQAGPLATVRAAFATPRPMPKPREVDEFDEERPEIRRKVRTLDPVARKEYLDEIRRRSRLVFADYAVQWFRFASDPANSPQEKLVAWLQNILVVGARKVRVPGLLFDYQETLRTGLRGDYPALLTAVMRHPAMIRYLDLNNSTAKAPNENFARELFELFTLGEGRYTEKDIKEAARALTGIRLREGDYHFDPRTHDPGSKTIFGKTGDWGPQDVIRITAERPDLATFVADDFLKTFVTPGPVPRPFAEELGRRWRAQRLRILALPELVFTSAWFFHPENRGALIKSPHEFYIGLCQDLGLSTAAYPGDLLPALRPLGQEFFEPPNVRGWVGDRTWINSSTYAARRRLVAGLFRAIDETRLNADDRAAVERLRETTPAPLRVSDARLEELAASDSPEALAAALESRLLPLPASPAFHNTLVTALTGAPPRDTRILRETLVALLQSPSCQLA